MEAVNPETPKWLKRIQENSWEAEILISGGAIFSLFQLGDFAGQYILHIKEIRQTAGINEITMFLFMGINGITIGFITHLVLRAFWIALVCLNFAYPSGINLSKLKITGKYLERSRSQNLTEQIIKLDRMSGLIYFSSLVFILIFLGIIVTSSALILLYQLFGLPDPYFNLLMNVFSVGYLIFLVDFISGGWLRINKTISKIYRPLYLFYNTLTLAFLYREWLQIIFSNTRKAKLVLMIGAYLILSAIFTWQSLINVLFLPNRLENLAIGFKYGTTGWTERFYENRLKEGLPVYDATVQSDIINDDFLKVFVHYWPRFNELVEKSQHKTFQGLIKLKLDHVPIDSVDWLVGVRWQSHQRGVFTYLPIQRLATGKHELTIELGENDFSPYPLTIPFWKESGKP